MAVLAAAPTHSPLGAPGRLPKSVDAYLNGTLDLVVYGLLDLDQLPRPVAALIFFGEALGRNSRQHEIDQLEADCDRYYRAACNGGFSSPLRSQGRTFAELEALRNAPAA
jgi:hypothetical protein